MLDDNKNWCDDRIPFSQERDLRRTHVLQFSCLEIRKKINTHVVFHKKRFSMRCAGDPLVFFSVIQNRFLGWDRFCASLVVME